MQHIVPISLTKILKGFLVFVILVLISLFLSYFFWQKITNSYPFNLIDSFFQPNYENVLVNSRDRVNLLVLGIGGEGHEGADLTDSMIFLSVPVKNQKESLVRISLPRDIWSEKYSTKINSLYHYGGFNMVSEGVMDVLGLAPDYVFLIDFSSFREVVDVLGGINVLVHKGFVDNKYPISGRENDLCNGDVLFLCRYKTVSFSQGEQYMNGEMALIYVRSRHSEGDTGTDFARGVRQQEVIDAILNKLVSPEVLTNSKIYSNLVKVISTNVKSNTTNDKIPLIIRALVNNQKMRSFSMEDYLYSPVNYRNYDNQYVLIPKSGNWNKMQKDLDELLKRNPAEFINPENPPEVNKN